MGYFQNEFIRMKLMKKKKENKIPTIINRMIIDNLWERIETETKKINQNVFCSKDLIEIKVGSKIFFFFIRNLSFVLFCIVWYIQNEF